jgi:membrane-bound lytic murein transglycosylase B
MKMEPLMRTLAAMVVIGTALLCAGEASAQSSGDGLSLFGNIFSGPNAGTPAQPQATPGNGAALPWSGEDGASGHPLMTAAAIRQAAANFDNCVASMWPDATFRGKASSVSPRG